MHRPIDLEFFSIATDTVPWEDVVAANEKRARRAAYKERQYIMRYRHDRSWCQSCDNWEWQHAIECPERMPTCPEPEPIRTEARVIAVRWF